MSTVHRSFWSSFLLLLLPLFLLLLLHLGGLKVYLNNLLNFKTYLIGFGFQQRFRNISGEREQSHVVDTMMGLSLNFEIEIFVFFFSSFRTMTLNTKQQIDANNGSGKWKWIYYFFIRSIGVKPTRIQLASFSIHIWHIPDSRIEITSECLIGVAVLPIAKFNVHCCLTGR